MKRSTIGLLVCVCLGLSRGAPHVLAQAQPAACSVAIADPKLGDRVGAEALVSGRATLPTGKYLWVFAHRKGLRLWWPQGAGAAQVSKGGEWAVLVNFGQPRDAGAEFEVTALVVDDDANASLDTWVKDGDRTGNYSGLSLPAFVSGCEPPLITVRRAR
jgi:hypothetical protein